MENLRQRAVTKLNAIFVKLFNNILRIEEKSLTKNEFTDLSLREMHVIEAIELSDRHTMSEIAKQLKITLSTLTTAVNHLVSKGYVMRQRSSGDRRVVYVSLTEKGKAAHTAHMQFHGKMVDRVMDMLSDEELSALMSALDKINNYFIQKYVL